MGYSAANRHQESALPPLVTCASALILCVCCSGLPSCDGGGDTPVVEPGELDDGPQPEEDLRADSGRDSSRSDTDAASVPDTEAAELPPDSMDVEPQHAAEALGAAQAPPGRMELFQASADGPAIVIDYAHTPDALAKAIAAAREHFTGRVLTVFGCGGDRDKGKRPQMGRVAEAASDVVFVTDDNPRSEDGDAIVADILEGMEMRPVVERDRAGAIEQAWSAAAAGDVVLVAGKGHEDYQIVGDERYGISDRRIAMHLTGSGA